MTGESKAGAFNYPSNTSTGGTPGGTNGQIQYNNNGAFGGVTAVPVNKGGTGQTSAGATAANAIGALAEANNLSDVASAATSRTNLGLGSIATQAANNVAITGGAFDGTTIGANTPVQAQGHRPANAQTGTTYTFVLGDTDYLCAFNNASAITVTIPTHASVAMPVNAEIDCAQLGAGQVTFSPAGGVTLNSYTSKVKLAGQYAGATLKQTAQDVWLLIGNLA